jgi:hypothetical protein
VFKVLCLFATLSMGPFAHGFAEPLMPDKPPDQCKLAVEPAYLQMARVRLDRLLIAAGLVCAVSYGGYYLCTTVGSSLVTQASIATGLTLVIGTQSINFVKRFVGPQSDFSDQWLNRFATSLNQNVMQWLRGLPPRTKTMGDRVFPDHVTDSKAYRTDRQIATQYKVSSISSHYVWMGNNLPEYLRNGEIERAADVFVTQISEMARDNYEILLRTAPPHEHAVTRQMATLGFYMYLFKNFRKLFEEDLTLLPRFEAAVQASYWEFFQEAPLVHAAYSHGMKIVLNGYMFEYIRKMKDFCDYNWCIKEKSETGPSR